MTHSKDTDQTPLKEISPAALDELLSADPENLSDNDIETIRLHYRKEFADYKKKKATKASRTRKVRKELPQGGLSLADLGLPGGKK